MKFLSENGVSKFWSKIKSFFIQSDTVRKIVIVDEYPEFEEAGVLYLKKGSISSGGDSEVNTPTNLYYQDADKNYTSSSSGYSCNWSTDNTVIINSDTYMSKDAQRSSNEFLLSLKANTTYKLIFNYLSGSGIESDSSIGSINCALYNADTSTKIISETVKCGNSGEVSFIASEDGTINAEMQMYIYTGVYYQSLKYEIALYEVS